MPATHGREGNRMPATWKFQSAGSLIFGPGASEQLAAQAELLGASRLWLIADQNLAQAGIVERVLAPLKQTSHRVESFLDGEPEPSIATAEACIKKARAFAPDAVVGLGGGSNLDLAKIVALVLAQGGTLRDYLGDCRVPGPTLPSISLPTTAGTGSEVSCAAVLTDTENHIKVSTLSPHLRPEVALVDPLLTVSCPPKVTADSGIDALTHAIEAYLAVDNEKFSVSPDEKTVYQGRNPLGNLFAERAIALVAEHLPTAFEEPENHAAREGMALAATLGGLAFSNVGVGLVHAMEYPVGGAVHCSHGAGNGLLLPFVMRFLAESRQAALAEIAKLMQVITTESSEAEAAESGIRAVEELRARIGIPEKLSDLGVTSEQLPGFAEKAFAIKRLMRMSPRPVVRQDILNIYEAAL